MATQIPDPPKDLLHDLLIVGGGINGAGMARDAAGRGLRVALCERGDLAGATSSASSKLIHGGLRYLEYFEFRLVREALAEREVLLHIAPHLVRPLRFVLPLVNTIRPAWMVRLGLFIYDHLGPHPSLPNSSSLNLRREAVGEPLRGHMRKGFAYYDCWVDDARLVVLNALDAAHRGARIMTRTELVSARWENGIWHASLLDGNGRGIEIQAKVLVNAAGPWVEEVLPRLGVISGSSHKGRTVLIKGSHIIVPRLFGGAHAYILQHTDGRVIFIMPYQDAYSLIGTTDVPFDGDPGTVQISTAEIEYLCHAVNAYFDRRVMPEQVCWSFAGVRPLFGDGDEDPSAVTRDYVLELDGGGAPLLSIYGGKITTYRRLAEAAMDRLSAYFPNLSPNWTATSPLPGGEGGLSDLSDLPADYPNISANLIRQLVARHGTLAREILGKARTAADLGYDFGAGLTAREIDYMVANEWAVTAEDILWRRSKCGLHLGPAQCQAVADYLE